MNSDNRQRQLLLETYVRLASDEADHKLRNAFIKRYMQIWQGPFGNEVTVEKIRKADPEWTRICKSIGISRRPRSVLPGKPPAETVFVKDPEPLSSFNDGMLVMPYETAEKILALGFVP